MEIKCPSYNSRSKAPGYYTVSAPPNNLFDNIQSIG